MYLKTDQFCATIDAGTFTAAYARSVYSHSMCLVYLYSACSVYLSLVCLAYLPLGHDCLQTLILVIFKMLGLASTYFSVFGLATKCIKHM